jgi:hypothetical protein
LPPGSTSRRTVRPVFGDRTVEHQFFFDVEIDGALECLSDDTTLPVGIETALGLGLRVLGTDEGDRQFDFWIRLSLSSVNVYPDTPLVVRDSSLVEHLYERVYLTCGRQVHRKVFQEVDD